VQRVLLNYLNFFLMILLPFSLIVDGIFGTVDGWLEVWLLPASLLIVLVLVCILLTVVAEGAAGTIALGHLRVIVG